MSTYDLETKITKMQEWEALAEEAEAEAEALRDEIKAELIRRNAEEVTTGKYIVRWTSVLSQRFDSTAFKRAILNMGLVENTLTGNLILTVMLAFAEYERGMIVERTQTGKAVARQDPNYREGRPRKYTGSQMEHALSLLRCGNSYKQVEAMTGISKSTLLRAKR